LDWNMLCLFEAVHQYNNKYGQVENVKKNNTL